MNRSATLQRVVVAHLGAGTPDPAKPVWQSTACPHIVHTRERPITTPPRVGGGGDQPQAGLSRAWWPSRSSWLSSWPPPPPLRLPPLLEGGRHGHAKSPQARGHLRAFVSGPRPVRTTSPGSVRLVVAKRQPPRRGWRARPFSGTPRAWRAFHPRCPRSALEAAQPWVLRREPAMLRAQRSPTARGRLDGTPILTATWFGHSIRVEPTP